MRSLLLLAIIALTLIALVFTRQGRGQVPLLSTSNQTTLIGTHVPERFYGYLVDSKMPQPHGLIWFQLQLCPGLEEYAGIILGCADRDSVWITPQRQLIKEDRGFEQERWTFNHELGHVVDFRILTKAKRATIRRLIRAPNKPWWGGSNTSVTDRILIPAELFADAYADCALYGRISAPVPAEETGVCRAFKKLLR